MVNIFQLTAGLVLAAVIAGVSYRIGALDTSGAIATTVVGALTFGFGGLTAGILLVLFFVSSSALTFLRKEDKRALAGYSSKGGRRDASQVLANGSVAAITSVLFGLSGEVMWLTGVAGALAASTADTWGTEVGVLSRQLPRMITNGSLVPHGTSGGVTFNGSLAGVGGAALIGLAAAVLTGQALMFPIVILAGTIGMMVDSLLGATIQGIYYCPVCEKETEQYPVHHCGTHTSQIHGQAWMDNDLVNFLSTVTGALFAGIFWRFF
jgi:uncharacterized protein (TIGR00297 family)